LPHRLDAYTLPWVKSGSEYQCGIVCQEVDWNTAKWTRTSLCVDMAKHAQRDAGRVSTGCGGTTPICSACSTYSVGRSCDHMGVLSVDVHFAEGAARGRRVCKCWCRC